MKIASYLNTTEADVLAKKFNIFIGISLGNKYFTKEHIKDYLLWALDNTKEKVAVLIPDKIHAINYEVKNGYSAEKANRIALQEGEKVKNIIKKILNGLTPKKHNLVEIFNWKDIETEKYKFMTEILRRNFKENEKFRNLIIEAVKENVKSEKLNDSDYEKLSTYPIEELPLLIGGIEYRGIIYNLLPYPGVSKIDYLTIDLQEGKTFPNITRELKIENKLRIIEAYAE